MKKRAIICVDDDKAVLLSIKEQLKNNFGLEYRYETADNADDTFLLLDDLSAENVSILIIVADWLMPGIKGDQLLVEIHKKHPDVVTILLTGHADENAVDNAKQNANLHACIYKPWDEKTLVNSIKEAISKMSSHE